jgi:diguanylate cyclase (GGDEF)-like protein
VPAEPLLILLVAAIAINVVLLAVVAVAVARDRRPRAPASPRAKANTPLPIAGVFGTPLGLGDSARFAPQERAGRMLVAGDGVPATAFDRVVRVVSWAFILAVATIVAVSGQWPSTQTAIFVLLVLAGLFVLTVHDILPLSFLGSARYVVEGSVAITFATLLLVLTGGSASPFFFAYALIVAGAALVLAPRPALLVTTIAIGSYGVGVAADPARLPLTEAQLVAVGVNVAALILLTYVATVVAKEQRRSRDAAIQLSTVDSLTGLCNRAYLSAAVDREIQRSARSGRGFCVVMMDLDELKPINDRYGHFHGDRVLRGVSEIIRHGVRRIDTAARYGGDEFVVLLPETDPPGALILAEKIRQGAADLAIETQTERIRTSLSIGVVSYPEDGRTADDLMISADRAMYLSKRRGKNRVIGAVGTGAATGARPILAMGAAGHVGTMGARASTAAARPARPANGTGGGSAGSSAHPV